MMTSRDLHIQTRQLFTIVGSVSVLLVLAQVAHASTVIGVTGAYDNGGSPNTVFEVDVTTGVLTDLGSTESVVPNSLACNVEDNLLYYGDHSGTDLYRFNLDTLTNDHVADLVSIFGTGDLVAGQILSGGATYDSTSKRYYFIPEEASSGAGASISWLEFNAAGTSVVDSGTLTPDFSGTSENSLGNFGDIAVSGNTLYGSSDTAGGSLGNSLNSFWSMDLTSLVVQTFGPEYTGPAAQIAFDGNGELWANFFNSANSIFKVNTSTGALTDPQSMGANFYDMASTQAIPEPSSLALALLGLVSVGMCTRRRRLAVRG